MQAPFTGLTAAFGAGTDADGNVYITGNTFDSGHRKNITLVKFNDAGDLLWEKVGGPGFGAGVDVAISGDNAVFISGNLLSDDPNAFGGPAFVAEFTSAGKAKKAVQWGGSPNDGASAESVAVDASGQVVTAGVAGPGPYTFGRASNSAKAPEAHLVVPSTSHVLSLPTTLGVDNGVLLVPDAAVGGDTDAFTLWLQR